MAIFKFFIATRVPSRSCGTVLIMSTMLGGPMNASSFPLAVISVGQIFLHLVVFLLYRFVNVVDVGVLLELV